MERDPKEKKANQFTHEPEGDPDVIYEVDPGDETQPVSVIPEEPEEFDPEDGFQGSSRNKAQSASVGVAPARPFWMRNNRSTFVDYSNPDKD